MDTVHRTSRKFIAWIHPARLLIAAAFLATPCTLFADDLPGFDAGGFNSAFALPGNSTEFAADEPKVSAALSPKKGTLGDAKPGDVVTLSIKIDVGPKSYTYPQNPTFGKPTKLNVTSSEGLGPVDKTFKADRDPFIEDDPIIGKVAKFKKKVTWSRTYRIAKDANPKNLVVKGTLDFQVCDENSCRTFPKTPFESVAGAAKDDAASVVALVDAPADGGSKSYAVADASTEKQGEVYEFIATERPVRGAGGSDPIAFEMKLTPTDAGPGDEVTLSITATLDSEKWHVFALTQNPENAGLPTVIKVNAVNALVPLERNFSPDSAPKVERPESQGGKSQRTHYGEVTWSRRFRVADDVEPGEYGVEASIRYQICSERNCLAPKTIRFQLGDLTLSAAPVEPQSSFDLSEKSIVIEEGDAATAGLGLHLLFAFLGGLILNVMPCVLPVLAIKVLGFMQQAGEDRGRVFLLNVAYSGGVIGVFLVLATLAVVLGVGWGGLFQSTGFNIVMSCVVFAMGLSLLGVFEIPVPGFIGSAGGHEEPEGLTGAFMTGILATLLATPCTGPFMGATLAWSVQQPTHVVYLVWGVMGLGMAFPYLAIGLYPRAVKWLPQPGPWMVRFKEFSGFFLLATVIFLVSSIGSEYVVPLLIILLGLGLGLWMMGNMYDVSSTGVQKNTVRATALVLTGGICLFGYRLTQATEHLDWRTFEPAAVETHLAEGKTVLIDFTADWCLICKQNEKLALNTAATIRFTEENDVVPLMADYTNESPKIKAWLKKFKHDGVPLTAILRHDADEDVVKAILLRGPYSKSTLISRLEQSVNASTGKSRSENVQISSNPVELR